MRARRCFLLLALLPTALVALSAFAGEGGAHEVVRVVDGDTIVIDLDGKETKVRLIGVDTPETVDPREPVQYFGREARAFTKKLLDGKKVTLEYDRQKTDEYGRTLAYVYVGEVKDRLLVNEEIIRQGNGHAYLKYPFDEEKMGEFRAAEKDAMENGRGLWADRKEGEGGREAEGGGRRSGRLRHEVGG